jgi:hypothetical protein
MKTLLASPDRPNRAPNTGPHVGVVVNLDHYRTGRDEPTAQARQQARDLGAQLGALSVEGLSPLSFRLAVLTEFLAGFDQHLPAEGVAQ